MYPLKRAGERGEGKWQRITWEQALDEIAEKLTILKAKYGPETLAGYRGHCPRGAFSGCVRGSATCSVTPIMPFIPALPAL